uniref:Odorant receptor n=1 Tax=Lobesia botrana TaxID=209534 RepID=A0A345BEX2_9NEOP|nr:odorant receptors OR54 [Lobesia botrana]
MLKKVTPKPSSMKNSDCLTSAIAIMQYTGVWLPDNLEYRWRVMYMALRFVTQIVMFYFIILAEIGYVFKYRHDTERMVDAAVLLLSHLVQAVKVMTIVLRQPRIKRLIALGDGPEFTHTDPKLKAIIERAVKMTSLVSNVILCSASITGLFWCMVPALQDKVTLPLRTAYPFDISGTYIFTVMYVYSSVSVITVGVADAAENFLVSGVLILAATQVDLLNVLLMDIEGGKAESYEKAVLCIKFHQQILKYVEEIANIFNFPIFCQCVVTSAIVCMTIYKISVTQEPVELVTMIFYLLCVFTELLMYCYPADILLNKSLQTADAAIPIWSGNIKTAKALQMTVLRAQKPLTINAGGMFRISLPTAAAVVQTSYTYYTLLQQSLKK